MTASPGADGFGAFVPGPRATLAPTGQGPLDGLTVAVKDLVDVAGAPTGGGNPDWLRTHLAPAARSAPCVEMLLAAGATVDGKTITDELAFSLEGVNAHYGTPRNPACPDRMPGGSSSGSAVAVAAGLVDCALGTDTGGSVRVPASFNGVYGFRPTHGAVPVEGVLPFAPSYDTVGWFARDPRLLAIVGEVLLPRTEPTPLRRFRVAADAFALADDAPRARLISMLAAAGITSEVTVFGGEEAAWLAAYRVLQNAEIWASLGGWITTTNPRFGDAIAARFADAATITVADVEQHAPLRARISSRLRDLLGRDGVLVVPTTTGPAPRLAASGDTLGEFYRRALTLTSIAGHAGLPQVTIPALHVEGCPVGLSLIGPPGADRALLALACDWPVETPHRELYSRDTAVRRLALSRRT